MKNQKQQAMAYGGMRKATLKGMAAMSQYGEMANGREIKKMKEMINETNDGVI